jgi:hypothetical protein
MDKDFTIFLLWLAIFGLALAISLLVYAVGRARREAARNWGYHLAGLLLLTKQTAMLREYSAVNDNLTGERDMLLKRVRVLELEHGDMREMEIDR